MVLLLVLRPKLTRPARLFRLPAASKRERVGRDILGDHRTRADIGAVADLYRRDQRGIRAYKGRRADIGKMLVEAIVIAGDRTCADIGAGANARVADIG